MSFYAKQNAVAEYPAYIVYEREADSFGHVHLRAGEILLNHLSTYCVGSVISSAIKDNEDPVEELERTRKFGHDEHYIFGLGASLTSGKTQQIDVLKVDFEATYRFEGKLFKIVTAANNNLAFVAAE